MEKNTLLLLISVLLVAGMFGFLIAIPTIKKLNREYLFLKAKWEQLELKKSLKKQNKSYKKLQKSKKK